MRLAGLVCSVALLMAQSGCGNAPDAKTASPATDSSAAADAMARSDLGAADQDAAAPADVAAVDAQEPDVGLADSEAPDSTVTDAAPADIAPASDGAAAADAADIAGDVSEVKCTPGEKACEGPKLKSCLPKGNGWSISNCYPGTTCGGGKCIPVAANLIIAFDTSGSMSDPVKQGGVNKCPSGYSTWPDCEYTDPKFAGGCTRMGVSKAVFKQALSKIDESLVHMALFRFPQTSSSTSFPTCESGYYNGNDKITADNGAQSVGDASPLWYWNGLKEIMCVPFPPNAATNVKDAMALWMDGKESKGPPANPELRPDGSTPLGKTMFYLGEYIRNRVVIDGRECTDDESCHNVNYHCQAGKCVDPNRSCRETVVVLFTDGGESNSNSFFAPWVQAKRLAMGLGCDTDADCSGGATCQSIKNCKNDKGILVNCLADSDCAKGGKCLANTLCLPKETITGFFCSKGLTPCVPGAAVGDAAFCDGVCVPDPRPGLVVKASNMADNVLRSPDGKPFSVKVIVVDISGSTSASDISGSASIAISGGGKLLGADAGDPDALLQSLDAAFDIKTKKVCGQ